MVECEPVRAAGTAVVAADREAVENPRLPIRATWSRAIARFEYGSWSGVVAGFELSP